MAFDPSMEPYMSDSSETEIVPTVPRESGNTKQIPPSKHWIFTWNNYSEEDIEEIIGSSNSSKIQRFVFQEETGENGTPHLQGYIQFTTKKRPFSVFKTRVPHWEKCKNIEKSIEYCQKEDTRTGRQWFRGIMKPYKLEIRNWQQWQKDAKAILDAPIDDRTIHWFWDERGNVGKTVFCKWAYGHYNPKPIILSGKAADMKYQIVKYLDKTGILPTIILIDVPRAHTQFISYTGIEEVKNMFFCSGKYEGGQICGEPPHVIVMSNSPPDREKMSDDRWKLHNIIYV